jgi:hypothetical protein
VFAACAHRPAGPRFRELVERLDGARVAAARVRKWPGVFGRLAEALASARARRAAEALVRDYGIPAGELAVASGGSIAHIYVGRAPGGASLETIGARYPRLLGALRDSPGIGLVVARATAQGAMAYVGDRAAALDDPASLGALEPFRALGVPTLRRLVRRVLETPTAGDLVVYGAFAPAGAVSFDVEHGAHGGIHPDELDLFVLTDLALPDGDFDAADLGIAIRERWGVSPG